MPQLLYQLSRFINWIRTMPTDTDAVARESFAFWSPLVRLPVHAFALLGNEDGETSFRPHVVGDHGEAFGPFQWHAARADAMLAGCGIDVRTASHLDQLRAAAWEMGFTVPGLPSNPHGAYRHVAAQLQATDTLWSAVTVLVHSYEGSAQQARDVQRRVGLAEGWMKAFDRQH